MNHDDGDLGRGCSGRPNGRVSECHDQIKPGLDEVPRRPGGRILVGQVPEVALDVLPFPVPQGLEATAKRLEAGRDVVADVKDADPVDLSRPLRLDGQRRSQEADGQHDRQDRPWSSHRHPLSNPKWLNTTPGPDRGKRAWFTTGLASPACTDRHRRLTSSARAAGRPAGLARRRTSPRRRCPCANCRSRWRWRR